MKHINNFTTRNQPIISLSAQDLLSQKKVLFAGCGLGSCIAESFARLGLKNYILVDNDTIESHNLNRQSFNNSDINKLKVDALKQRILTINPDCKIESHPVLFNSTNSEKFISQCDIIIDTIDFLDLKAIIALHDEALKQNKPIISLFTAAWGAVGIFIPPQKDGQCWARDFFNIDHQHNDKMSYTESFISFFSKIQNQLNPKVVQMMNEVFKKMLDNKPCPAPNVIAGAQSASIIAQKLFIDYLDNKPIIKAPQFIYIDLEKILSSSILEIP